MWNDFKNDLVDAGLDEHPHVIENKIQLTRKKMSNKMARIVVARSMGIATTAASPEEHNKRLAEEMEVEPEDVYEATPKTKKRRMANVEHS